MWRLLAPLLWLILYPQKQARMCYKSCHNTQEREEYQEDAEWPIRMDGWMGMATNLRSSRPSGGARVRYLPAVYYLCNNELSVFKEVRVTSRSTCASTPRFGLSAQLWKPGVTFLYYLRSP